MICAKPLGRSGHRSRGFGGRSFQNVIQDSSRIFAAEKPVARQKLAKHDSDGIDVRRQVHLLAFGLLWRQKDTAGVFELECKT